MELFLTRRSFLALGASGLSLGAVGYFSAPANTAHGLPPQWDLLERALKDNRLGAIEYAHIAFAPERPADLWAILAMLHAHENWSRPRRVSVAADDAPRPDGSPVPFIGTVEVGPRVRITVDSRDHEPRTSAVSGTRGRLIVFPARAEFVTPEDAESHPIAWKMDHEYIPPAHSAAWSMAVCDALREAARRRTAIGFTDSGELRNAPLRVS